MFTLFFVVVQLPTSYQSIGVISLISIYLFTKFYTSKHLDMRVTQTCMFTVFFVVVEKGCYLPTSYQNVGVVSVIPTCLPSFMHIDILCIFATSGGVHALT